MSMNSLNEEISSCTRCPRLATYVRKVACDKVRRFSDETYHGRPVPGFGDVGAKLLIVGLAPAAHGANRTGRMFTGDSSGDWLTRAMYNAGFASQPTSHAKDDGLVLNGAYVTATARCAPPKNKPSREELENCLPFLRRELDILCDIMVIMCLGGIAYAMICKMFDIRPAKFGHGKTFYHGNYTILTSYHPSRQNTQTGRLTWRQWQAVFRKARRMVG